jgi:uncharacterized protein involved in outer membrane biogenesis
MADAGILVEDRPRLVEQHRSLAHIAIAAGLGAFATILGLIVLAWAILFITKGSFLKHPFERFASRYSGREVKVVGAFNLYFNPINAAFLAEGLTVGNPAWAPRPYFFKADRVDASIATIPLIFGNRRFNRLDLIGGAVDAEWDAHHKHNSWTFGTPDQRGKPFELPLIRQALIDRTTVRYVDPLMRLTTDLRIATIRSQNSKVPDVIRFAGGGTLRQDRFTVSGQLQSVSATLAGGRNKFELHAISGPTYLDVAGTLPGATVIEGADLTVRTRGRNLRDLFDFLGVAVPDTRHFRFTSHLTKDDGEWKFTRLHGSFGDSDLAGKLIISMPKERLLIVADLVSRSVDIIDIGPIIGYDPRRLDAERGKGAITTVGGTPRVLPDASLRIDALDNFDARVKYRVTDIKARSLPVSNIDLTLDLDHKLLKLSPLTMDVSRGHLSSDISIDARRPAVVTDYDIRLSLTPLGTLFRGFGLEQSGTTGTIKARIQMTGTGDSVHKSLSTANGRIAVILPKGTFWTRNVQLAELDVGTYVQKLIQEKLKKPVEVNCGLVAFTVRGGHAQSDPILIDTTKNVIIGRGGFDFGDESMNMNFRADAKTMSLFSGQSPIGLDGHFASPKIHPISPQLLTRAGIGVGLGALASPVAALLAFVDPGDAKAADCGPVLEGARAAAQRTAKGKPRKDLGKMDHH